MKPLSDVIPDPKEVLQLGPEKLGQHVLDCLSDTNEPNIQRAIIARTLSSGYHQSFQNSIAVAIEEAVDWLITQCVLGASPIDQDLVSLTLPSKKVLADYRAEQGADKA
jgi:hypothetical protein